MIAIKHPTVSHFEPSNLLRMSCSHATTKNHCILTGNNNNSININNNTNNLNNNNNNNNNNLNAHSKDISNVGGDQSCGNMTGSIATNGGSGGGGGGGSMGSNTDKESLTPSPSVRSNDDVKSEPMELVCSNVEHDNSSDSIVDEQHDMQHPVDMKGPIK